MAISTQSFNVGNEVTNLGVFNNGMLQVLGSPIKIFFSDPEQNLSFNADDDGFILEPRQIHYFQQPVQIHCCLSLKTSNAKVIIADES